MLREFYFCLSTNKCYPYRNPVPGSDSFLFLLACQHLHSKYKSCLSPSMFGSNFHPCIKDISIRSIKTGSSFDIPNDIFASPYFHTGLKEFKGKVLHSHDYLHARGYEGKRIMVIGVGNSGCDAAVELSREASKVCGLDCRMTVQAVVAQSCQWIRPQSLDCEVPGSNLLAAAV